MSARNSQSLSIVIKPDPLVRKSAISLATESGLTEAHVFGPEGGSLDIQQVATAAHVRSFSYTAKIDFNKPLWPVLEIHETLTTAEDHCRIVLAPATWLRHQTIYLRVRSSTREQSPDNQPEDYLVINVRYPGPGTTGRITESVRLTPNAPAEMVYLLGPGGDAFYFKLSAFGVIGGQVRQLGRQPLDPTAQALALVVDEASIKLQTTTPNISTGN